MNKLDCWPLDWHQLFEYIIGVPLQKNGKNIDGDVPVRKINSKFVFCQKLL